MKRENQAELERLGKEAGATSPHLCTDTAGKTGWKTRWWINEDRGDLFEEGSENIPKVTSPHA